MDWLTALIAELWGLITKKPSLPETPEAATPTPSTPGLIERIRTRREERQAARSKRKNP